MPGYTNKRPSGYLECDYENPWPGLITNLPASQTPPSSCTSCSAMVIRQRLNPQPAIFPPFPTGGTTLTLPIFSSSENVCTFANLQQPNSQQGPTVIITNFKVYIDFVNPASISAAKQFTSIFTFPTPYPRYARFGTCIIGNTLYFSSASQLGLYALRPTFSVASVEILNQGGYFTSAPSVVFSDGGGTGATGTALLTGSNLSSITLTNGGSGYIVPPIVNLNGGVTPFPLVYKSLAVAVGILSTNPSGYTVREISAFTGVANVDNGSAFGGTNYSAPTVAFIGGGGTGASATAVLSTDGIGSILAIVMNSFGQNYTSIPTVQVIDPTGSGVSIPSATLFNGLPFIGGDFMESINNRLVLGNIIGGDGNSTTSLQFGHLVIKGAGYTGFPGVNVVGGGGAGASIYALPDSGSNAGKILNSALGTLVQFTGTLTSGNNTITGVSSISGVQVGMQLWDFGYGITGTVTVTAVSTAGNATPTGNFTLGSTSISSVSSITGISPGDPISGNLVPPGTVVISASGSTVVMSQGALGTQSAIPFQVVIGNTITMSATAGQTTTETIAAFGFVSGNAGNGFYGQPLASVTGNSTLPGQIFPVLSGLVQRNSSQTRYPDRLAWSAPNAYGYFDPNWLTSPGGFNTLVEARGVISGLTVIESVLFIGHNGGETETTPAGSSQIPFAFYPLWSSDQGVLVRYGSMAQYGTTCCFLSTNSAFMLTPNGLQEIGQNIANLLQNCGIWNNGNFPLLGLYGSIVVIEGEMHYLLSITSDDWDLANGNSARSTTIFDYNLNESSWHQWNYPLFTLTCPIYQTFDTALYTPNSTSLNTQIARDSWLLCSLSQTSSGQDSTAVYEMAPLTRAIQVTSFNSSYSLVFIQSPILLYQFRTETPSIARMQQERRILIEYENQPLLGTLVSGKPVPFSPTLSLTYVGQQDPTAQTGTISQSQTQSITLTNLPLLFPLQPSAGPAILTQQVDFPTFTGICTNLSLSAIGSGLPNQWTGLISLVRITQVADLPKQQVP